MRKKRSWSKPGSATNRHSLNSTTSSRHVRRKFKKEGFSFNLKRRSMLRTWRSRLNCITKKWRRSLNLVPNKKKNASKSTTSVNVKLSKEKERSNSSRDCRPSRRSEHRNRRKRSDDRCVKTTNGRCRSTSWTWRRDCSRRNRAWYVCSGRRSSVCCRNTTRTS